jgi:hypothetical protein
MHTQKSERKKEQENYAHTYKRTIVPVSQRDKVKENKKALSKQTHIHTYIHAYMHTKGIRLQDIAGTNAHAIPTHMLVVFGWDGLMSVNVWGFKNVSLLKSTSRFH